MENVFNFNMDEDRALLNLSISKFDKYKLYLNNQEINKAIKETIELISEANVYCDKMAPWNLIKSDTKRMNEVLSLLIDIIRRSSLMLFPIMPGSIKKIYSILNINEEKINFIYFNQQLKLKHKIKNAIPIFPRIENIH